MAAVAGRSLFGSVGARALTFCASRNSRGSAARAFHATASTFDEARCPYAVLDLDPGASQKEVKKAYMVLVYHSESSHSFPCPVVLYGRHRDTCICRRGSCILTFRHTSTRRKNSPRSIVRTRCSQTRRLDDSMMLGRLIPKGRRWSIRNWTLFTTCSGGR